MAGKISVGRVIFLIVFTQRFNELLKSLGVLHFNKLDERLISI